MAAWSWYGPSRVREKASVIRATEIVAGGVAALTPAAPVVDDRRRITAQKACQRGDGGPVIEGPANEDHRRAIPDALQGDRRAVARVHLLEGGVHQFPPSAGKRKLRWVTPCESMTRNRSSSTISGRPLLSHERADFASHREVGAADRFSTSSARNSQRELLMGAMLARAGVGLPGLAALALVFVARPYLRLQSPPSLIPSLPHTH